MKPKKLRKRRINKFIKETPILKKMKMMTMTMMKKMRIQMIRKTLKKKVWKDYMAKKRQKEMMI